MALTAQLAQITRLRPTRSEIRAAGTTAATVPIATSDDERDEHDARVVLVQAHRPREVEDREAGQDGPAHEDRRVERRRAT